MEGRAEKKVMPCAVQRNRASRARKADMQIIAEYERYTKYAGWAFIALFALIFACEVLGW